MSDDQNEEIRRLEQRLAELKAGRSGPVGQGALNRPPKAKGDFNAAIVGLSLSAAVVLVLVVNHLAAAPAAPAKASAQDGPRTTMAGPDNPLRQSSGGWEYTTSEHGMGGQIRHACVLATTWVSLDWPYKTQQARLCLRRHPQYGLDAIVTLPQGGQFLCTSYDGCTVRIRFDDGPLQSFSAVEPSDGSSDSLFIQNDSRFMGAMKGAERVRIQAEFYQNGTQVMEFSTKGFDPARLN